MSDPNAAPSEQPAPETQEQKTAPASEQQQAVDHASQLETASLDELGGILFGEKAASDEPAPAEAEEEIPATPAAEEEKPGGEQQPEPEAPTPPAADVGVKIPGRVSVRGLSEEVAKETRAAVDLIRAGNATDMLDALNQLRGTAQPPARTEQPAPAAADAPVSAVSTLESELASLREQRDQARADYDEATVQALQDKIEDKVGELAVARVQETTLSAREEQAQQTFDQQVEDYADQVEATYPEASDPSSKFSELLDDKITAARARRDPALNSPDYVLTFAKQVAEVLKPVTKANTPPPPPPAVPSKPVGSGVAPGNAGTAALTRTQAEEAINNASSEDLGAALWKG